MKSLFKKKKNRQSNHKVSFGFTLIEVMVVLVIIGILGTVSLPTYRRYVQQGKVAEAHALLTAQRMRMEQSYQDNRTFVGACATGTSTALPASTRNFSFACSNLAAATYTVTATGLNGMSGFTFTITQDNVKATSAVPSGWTTSTTCWRTTPSGC